MKTKKKNRVKVVTSNSVNYTFIDESVHLMESNEPHKNRNKKIYEFTRKTLKDHKTTKTHYKFNKRSPKSQQGHSPVYE